MTGVRLLVALSATVLTIGVATPAHAQTSGKQPRKAKVVAAPRAATPAGDAAASGEDAAPAGKKAAPRKVVKLEEMRVEGRVQKPQALFLMPRASVTTGDQERTESFLSKTTDAVKKDPF